MEEIKVPMNVREQYDTSEINVGMNNIENELGEAPLTADDVYIPEPGDRTINVIERIQEISKFYEKKSDKE